ncbi:Reverse transcriptase (RNA-dependent DNA polymerase) [Ceratocystis platani]|uniref:Reverse transcriptase (RNA-dependent DNA polymerase) n=1 Tax=Ceratocystis fimbriata f. sp. platani TaxID=88771 RepID=A0A0F8CU37_CERFI|nr:Reverse transcriptase (RNA-dependent DNA polymerase) [Ceratocystis platani]
MVAIPKPQRDKTLLRSYQLSSLLLILGKSLERVVARKLSTQGVELQIIPVHYASAVPRRAATDITWKLADVIMGELKMKKITSLVTFDAVKKERLIARLRSQRWPESLCKRVASFLTDRQDSRVSPILYMLFMADLFKRMQNLGYADGGLIYVSSLSVKANLLPIREWLRMATRWCSENELEIDWSKMGLIHLYKGRKAAGMDAKLQMPDGTWLALMEEERCIQGRL